MEWYEADVLAAIAEREKCTYDPETIFYGSSTFTLWKTLHEEFREFKPVNLGFGGSTLAACVWFFNKIVAPIPNPKRLILYAGDNDLGDGRRPEEVYIFYHEFKMKLRQRYGSIPFYFVSVKPSVDRVEIIEEIIYLNQLVKADVAKHRGNDYFIDIYKVMIDSNGRPQKKFFKADGLHLNSKGYALWKEEIVQALQGT
jgi:hypothetical protein